MDAVPTLVQCATNLMDFGLLPRDEAGNPYLEIWREVPAFEVGFFSTGLVLLRVWKTLSITCLKHEQDPSSVLFGVVVYSPFDV